MARNIVIYQDEGVGEFGLKSLAQFFRDDEVWFANADAVIHGRVLGMADVFVMPGGADVPYCRKLNGAGNENIRAYVEEGGTYLGVCAGAYYACKTIEWHKGRGDAITGKRELAFVNAAAIGSIAELAPFYDETLQSAAIINLEGNSVYYHGGPYFRLNNKGADVLARYEGLPFDAPAIVRAQVGDGTVILSGVHFEIGPEQLAKHPDEPERAAALAAQFKNRPDWHALLFGHGDSE